MDRRAFVTGLGAALAAPGGAGAQQGGRLYRVALIFTTSPVGEMHGLDPVHPLAKAFVHGLRTLGYSEGQNVIVERRSAEGREERFGDIVAELVRLKADVIVVAGTSGVRAAKAVTASVPIVMAAAGDPVGNGLVQSLARPGGNVTGLAVGVGSEVEVKRLQFLRDMLPGISRIAYLGTKDDLESEWTKSIRTAAPVLGVTLVPIQHPLNHYTDAFAMVGRLRPDAIFVSSSPASFAHRRLIVDAVTRLQIPSSFAYRDMAELGGLMSYGVNFADLYRRAAGYVDKILKGAQPGELPVEQPTKYELAVNLKTAKALGLTIPPSLLLRADQVIE